MAWIWRALAPGLPESVGDGPETALRRVHEGRTAEVRCLVCSPATLEALLEPGDRKPHADRGGAAEAVPGEPPPFAPVEAGPALPVSRLSSSALESYGRCGYRFSLERVLGLRDWAAAAVAEPAVAQPAVAEPAVAEPAGGGPADRAGFGGPSPAPPPSPA